MAVVFYGSLCFLGSRLDHRRDRQRSYFFGRLADRGKEQSRISRGGSRTRKGLFGRGPWHAECRGDAAGVTKVLEDFAKMDRQDQADHRQRRHRPQLLAQSQWRGGQEGRRQDRLDLHGLVEGQLGAPRQDARRVRRPVEARDRESGPPIQLDIYTGGNVRWADVKVTDLKIDDRRLEARGFGAQGRQRV